MTFRFRVSEALASVNQKGRKIMKTSMIAALTALAVQGAVAAISCIVDAGTETYSRSTACSTPGTLDVKTRSAYAKTCEYAVETRFRTKDESAALSLATSRFGTVIIMR